MGSLFFKALIDTRLYPLTDRNVSGLSHAQQVIKLSEGGVTLVQLREKFLPSLAFYREVVVALQVARRLGVTVVINDRVDIALASKADGVHLGQDDLPADVARCLLGDGAIIGLSTHNREQALLAAKLPIDYIAIGPIFATGTKESSNTPVGLSGLLRVREAIGEMPLVAIGGITTVNSKQVLDAGADAVAVITDLWNPREQVTAQTTQLLHRQS